MSLGISEGIDSCEEFLLLDEFEQGSGRVYF